MKQLIELKNNIKDRNYFVSQFDKKRNINYLFVNPSLSGKSFYRMLLPAIKLPEIEKGNIATAITNISEFGMYEQLTSFKILDMFAPENDAEDKLMMINWATHIIFPFTLIPLTYIYDHIREINNSCKILFNIDFNYMELPENHELKPMFSDEFTLSIIDDNGYYSDSILVGTGETQQYFINHFQKLIENKYFDAPIRYSNNEMLKVNVIPFLIDEKLMMENVYHVEPELEIKKDIPIIAENNDTINSVNSHDGNLDNSLTIKKERTKRANKPKIKIDKIIKKRKYKKQLKNGNDKNSNQ